MSGAVVTVFPRNRGKVCLLRSAGSSHLDVLKRAVDGDPESTAMDVVRELLVSADRATIARIGDRVVVDEDASYPVLVDVPDRDLTSSSPIEEVVWRHPTELLETCRSRGPWSAYREIGPTRETVLSDRTHGSASLSLKALEVLRDRSGELARSDRQDGWETLVSIARELATDRPEMTVLANRVDRAMTLADGSVSRLEATCREHIERAARSDEMAGASAASRCSDATVLSLSRSGTVERALTIGAPATVILLESRPHREAIAMGESLVNRGVDVTLTLDAGLGHAFSDGAIDLVLLGADTVAPDGAVYNKVGSRTAAVVANAHDVPVVVAASSDKIAAEEPEHREAIEGIDVYEGTAEIGVECPLFDRTESVLVDAYVTERGTLDPEGISDIAATHRSNREWRNDRS